MNRIIEISNFIDNNDLVIDIGCDQVKLGILLAKKGIKSIASDISQKVIDKAQEKVNNLNLNDYIKLVVSNGLLNIKDKYDTLVLSGMGSYTIIDILKEREAFKKVITVSNSDNDMLRTYMSKNGYKIKCEKIIKENNKYYNLIVFVPGKEKYNESELLYGTNHLDKKMYIEYINYLYDKYINIINNSNIENSKLNNYIKYLEEIRKLD